MQKNYSNKEVAGLLSLLLLIIVALKITPYSIFLIAAFLFYALLVNKVEYTYALLVLMLTLSVVNTALVEKDFSFYLVTRGSIFLLAVVMTLHSGASKNAWFITPFYILVIYILYMMGVSAVGWAPLISELKAVLFLVFIVAFIYLVSTVNMKEVDVNFVRSMMLVVALFFIMGSIAVIPFPSIGQSMMYDMALKYRMDVEVYKANLGVKSLFNGVTWHSQTLGPLICVLNAFILSDYLCSFKKKNYLYLSLICAAPILIYMTSSRTALFAYVISILSSLYFFLKDRKISNDKRNKVLFAAMGIFLLGIIVVSCSANFRSRVEAFLRKEGDVSHIDRSDTLEESLTQSRLGLVEKGLANFKESPVIGNGFQVAKEMRYISKSDTGLILSAPVEKGVLPIMILEEGGVVGAAIFMIFLITIYIKFTKLKMNCFLATFTVMLAQNTGEATFFSTSGAGGILWAICFTSLIIDVDRNRRKLAQQQMKLFQGIQCNHLL